MKTTIKAFVSVVIAVSLAFVFRYMVILATDKDEATVNIDAFFDMMNVSKGMFLEKPDTIQLLAPNLLEFDDLTIIRGRDGTPYIEKDGGIFDLETLFNEDVSAYILSVMSEYESGTSVLNIKVTSKALLFYTHYHEAGCVGFLYERELDNTDYYDTIEIVENWKVFFKLDEH